MNTHLGAIETIGLALVILFIGYFLNYKIPFLKRNNIPEPVVGGITFAILTAILYSQFNFTLTYEMDIKNPLMLIFFTTVGLGASFKLLAKGGPKVVLFLAIATVYLIFQNFIGVGLATLTDLNPLSGMLAGSITLSGGHGTGATYASMFTSEQNIQGTMELAMACATFGLVLGGIIGGPVTQRLIKKHKLTVEHKISREESAKSITYDPEDEDRVTPKRMMETFLILCVCISVGAYGYEFFKGIGVPLPSFICPLLVGIVICNFCDFSKVYKLSNECIDLWGTMSLSVFLAMALMSLRIWELANLAGPMVLILIAQTAFLAFYTTTITFRVMGKDYHAAIMAGGHCGFGLGATPTAVANMEALVSKYGPSPTAFLVVPMVGAFFIDITNTLVIQLYLALPFVN